jgi:hypothetical protein
VERLHIVSALANEFKIKRANFYKFLEHKLIKPLIEEFEDKVEKLENEQEVEGNGGNVASIGFILEDLADQLESAKTEGDGELRLKIVRTISDTRQRFKDDTEDYIVSIQKVGTRELMRRTIESMIALFGNERTKKALIEAYTEAFKEDLCTT